MLFANPLRTCLITHFVHNNKPLDRNYSLDEFVEKHRLVPQQPLQVKNFTNTGCYSAATSSISAPELTLLDCCNNVVITMLYTYVLLAFAHLLASIRQPTLWLSSLHPAAPQPAGPPTGSTSASSHHPCRHAPLLTHTSAHPWLPLRTYRRRECSCYCSISCGILQLVSLLSILCYQFSFIYFPNWESQHLLLLGPPGWAARLASQATPAPRGGSAVSQPSQHPAHLVPTEQPDFL